MDNTNNTQFTLQKLGEIMLRYGLVIMLLWVGALKFLKYEAEGIKPMVENSGLLSWFYDVMSVQMFSNIIGVIEIILAVLIATRYFAPKVSAIGSIGTIIMFLITLSFLLTTPGVWQQGYGFPSPSPMPGQFLAKDLVLLGVAVWSAGEALAAAKIRSNENRRIN